MLWQKYQQQDNNQSALLINKQQLSEQFAVAPRSINRILFELRENNIIAINGEHIQILDVPRLQQYTEH